MRLEVLNRRYSLRTKVLFGVVRIASGYPLPDAAKLAMYRPDFYGSWMGSFTQLAMRGPSRWSVADRELMAAYVSKANECSFCIGAHTATSATAYGDESKVAAALSDLDTAPVEEGLRATLRMLGKLTREHRIEADDVRAVLAAGVLPEQIRDALAVCFAFNATNRLSDAFGFEAMTQKGYAKAAQSLLGRGYG
jgi:uncharacterized peroxidase-related enzyme